MSSGASVSRRNKTHVLITGIKHGGSSLFIRIEYVLQSPDTTQHAKSPSSRHILICIPDTSYPTQSHSPGVPSFSLNTRTLRLHRALGLRELALDRPTDRVDGVGARDIAIYSPLANPSHYKHTYTSLSTYAKNWHS